MYKLMIVDDEYNIRNGLSKLVPWERIQVQVVCCARDGEEALERMPEFLPDLVITDIKMDRLDGLAFVETCKTRWPHVKIVILTGYSDFEYAHKALSLGICSYLLKPMLPDELLEQLAPIVKEMDEERRLKHRAELVEAIVSKEFPILRANLLSDFLFRGGDAGQFLSHCQTLGIRFHGPRFVCLLFLPEFSGCGEEERLLLSVRACEIIRESLERGYGVFILTDPDGRPVCLLDGAIDETRLADQLEKLRCLLSDALELRCTICLGSVTAAVAGAPESYRAAKKLLQYRLLASSDCVIANTDSLRSQKPPTALDGLENKIVSAVLSLNESLAGETVSQYFAALHHSGYGVHQMRLSLAALFFRILAVAEPLQDAAMEAALHTAAELADGNVYTLELLQQMFERAVAALLADKLACIKKGSDIAAGRALRYIDDHIGDPDLSLQSAAQHLYLSPNYFSSFFKKQTGKMFMSYIVEKRMSLSCRLLRDTNMRIAEVAQRAGYQNVQYFSTAFKKQTGVTPSEYRERTER